MLLSVQYSDLEKAISTLVSQFHSASADKSPELKPEEFKGLLSSQMPSLKVAMNPITMTESKKKK